MCNCGKGRQQIHTPQSVPKAMLHQPMATARTQVLFEYTGQTALTMDWIRKPYTLPL